VGLVLQLAWLEVQVVGPMLAAARTRLKIKLRQEKIVPLKSFACSYRLGANSGKAALS